MIKHKPVLLNGVLETLGDIKAKHIIDATFGAGGYTRAFLEKGAYVTAFDRDPNVLEDVNDIKEKYGEKFSFIQGAFSLMGNLKDKYDAIVFDLGISSMQIDNAERGFSFRYDAPLDMRMSAVGQSARDVIVKLSVDELARLLSEYGDVKKAFPIAKAIKEKLPRTTFELRDLVYNPKDVAPVFQALRIAVNDEMGEIKKALSFVPKLLKENGICICVTFNSQEDRFVKNVFRNWSSVSGDPRLPIVSKAEFELLNTFTPSKEELNENQRARSAHLRAVKKSC